MLAGAMAIIVNGSYSFADARVASITIDDPPAAPPYSEILRTDLANAYHRLGQAYTPRTHYLRADGTPRYVNRLIREDSPYLLQHAHNPVNWYSWGTEAFDAARRQDKPVFLSIGYSTCHWCHVMERESFDNENIAELLNEKFIAIKVDREQRPDLDNIYMTSVQMITGRGGWPMSSFLTPEGRPFYGGTYFPPQQFTELLERVALVWTTERNAINDSANQITTNIRRILNASSRGPDVSSTTIERAIADILSQYDAKWGGFGSAPKFPREAELLLLLQAAQRDGHEQALAAADWSLTLMAQGGIYDQVGGGFHRYSTDRRWLVPHFEKMLYNQALLGRAYLVAYRLTGEPRHRRVAEQTLEYVLRDMRHADGGFFSATDADSEGSEGTFFLWTPREIEQILGIEDAKLARQVFGVTSEGNFEGRNILHLPVTLEQFAAENQYPLADLVSRIDRIREKLRIARAEREHPLRDEKVLTAWNSMLITTLAYAYEVLEEKSYLQAARDAALFLWNQNRDNNGRLYRINLQGRASIQATQEDYAYFAEALLALYDASHEVVWLSRALNLVQAMEALFWDTEQGGFFMTSRDYDENLIARAKSPADNGVPSGSSVAVRVLALLAQRTDGDQSEDKARAALAAYSAQIDRYPSGYAYLLIGADELLRGASGPRQYAARGRVRVTGAINAEQPARRRLSIELDIDDGWHVTAHNVAQDDLAARITAHPPSRWRLASIRYPDSQPITHGDPQLPVEVYRGKVTISAELQRHDESATRDSLPLIPVMLRLQTCNTTLCLPVEEVRLEIPQHAKL